MSGKTYYIDPSVSSGTNDGLSPSLPLKDYTSREYSGGDSILFKRGTVLRGALITCDGEAGAPITYGAYGEGDKPTFLGSVSAGDPQDWIEERPSIWRYAGTFSSEVCNLIFNGGEFCGNLRWQIEDLQQPGEWHFTGIGRHGIGESHEEKSKDAPSELESSLPENDVLYLCSPTNPGLEYSAIECALWGAWKLAGGQNNIVMENLSFQNAGVHGYQGVGARNIVIRDCEFKFIGGAVWHRGQRIRFGNAVEFWDGASDITVEGCLFNNIYDSGVTHQGGLTRNIPERLYFRNNLFIDCGMSAYECREPSREVYFEFNTSINAGGGFSMQGETPPRQSEIYPQPMGHHVFIWRIEPNTQLGKVYIRHNVFSEAPYGGAIYSIIDSADERQFIFDHNCYWQTSGQLLIHINNRDYLPAQFSEHQATGQDGNSVVAEPQFRDIVSGDYRLRADSPHANKGIQSVPLP